LQTYLLFFIFIFPHFLFNDYIKIMSIFETNNLTSGIKNIILVDSSIVQSDVFMSSVNLDTGVATSSTKLDIS
jgi:hypothetical protein